MNVTNKRWVLASLVFFLFAWALSLFINQKSDNNHEIIFTDIGFDTAITFHAQCSDKEFEIYSSIVQDTFKENHILFDTYHDYPNQNNIYTLNHKKENILLETSFIDCLQLASSIHQIAPQYDASMGSLLSLWHEARESGNLLNEDQISTALLNKGMDQIQIRDNQVSILNPDIQIDLGGIAKGYTAQLAKEALEKAGCKHGFINAGGNVVLIGNKEDSSHWTIGIQNPDKAESILSIQAKKDQTFVTSGDYQRFIEIDGIKYNHIIDPSTGYPANYMRSVTVITTKDSGWADGASTALFCMDYESGKQWAQEQNIDCVWIFDSNNAPKEKPNKKVGGYSIYWTDGLNKQINI